MDLWTEEILLNEVVWTCGPVDLWTCGPVDLWTEDIHLYEVVWTCGPVDLWTCGLVDMRTCGPARYRYVRRHAVCMQLYVLKK